MCFAEGQRPCRHLPAVGAGSKRWKRPWTPWRASRRGDPADCQCGGGVSAAAVGGGDLRLRPPAGIAGNGRRRNRFADRTVARIPKRNRALPTPPAAAGGGAGGEGWRHPADRRSRHRQDHHRRRGIVALFQKNGAEHRAGGPTGRAAKKRMSELTGMEAQTVHRGAGDDME